MERNTCLLEHLWLAALAGAMGDPSGASVFELDIPSPALDQWFYPFNTDPCCKPTAAVFGSLASTGFDPSFDNRDGQMLLMRKKRGLGTFMDREEIDRKRPFYTTELLQGIPSVTLVQGRYGSTHVLMRGSMGGMCSPTIYVDGLRFGSADIDFVSFPEDLEAVEVYVRGSQSPPMFSDVRGTCGSIVLWSRRYMGTLRRR